MRQFTAFGLCVIALAFVTTLNAQSQQPRPSQAVMEVVAGPGAKVTPAVIAECKKVRPTSSPSSPAGKGQYRVIRVSASTYRCVYAEQLPDGTVRTISGQAFGLNKK